MLGTNRITTLTVVNFVKYPSWSVQNTSHAIRSDLSKSIPSKPRLYWINSKCIYRRSPIFIYRQSPIFSSETKKLYMTLKTGHVWVQIQYKTKNSVTQQFFACFKFHLLYCSTLLGRHINILSQRLSLFTFWFNKNYISKLIFLEFTIVKLLLRLSQNFFAE